MIDTFTDIYWVVWERDLSAAVLRSSLGSESHGTLLRCRCFPGPFHLNLHGCCWHLFFYLFNFVWTLSLFFTFSLCVYNLIFTHLKLRSSNPWPKCRLSHFKGTQEQLILVLRFIPSTTGFLGEWYCASSGCADTCGSQGWRLTWRLSQFFSPLHFLRWSISVLPSGLD